MIAGCFGFVNQGWYLRSHRQRVGASRLLTSRKALAVLTDVSCTFFHALS